MTQSTSESARALPIAPHRAALRRLQQALFPTDADFEGFCLDYFPVVHSRFSRDLDRVAKVNLLLELTEPAEVLARMRECLQKDPSALATIDHLLGEPRNDDERRTRAQWESLERLYQQREKLRQRAESTADIDKEIVAIKRSQRKGSQIAEGEVLKDRYRLIENIGRGGFAKVWKAFDRLTHRSVAVKILYSQQGDGPRRFERFQRGARQMQGLNHPHVVRVLDGPDEHNGAHYFVMEYLPGGDLHQAVLAKRIDRTAALRAVFQVGAALEHAHQRGLVHRDVKPQNILLDEQGAAHLTDFDLVWAADTTGGTRTGAMGTFLFSAPEEMEDASRVDRRADVYSLGMTTVFVLYGKNLTRKVLDARVQFIDELDCSPEIKDLLRRATAPDPEDRPATVEVFCQQLTDALRGGPHALSSRRSGSWRGLSVAILGFFSLTAGGYLWSKRHPRNVPQAVTRSAPQASASEADAGTNGPAPAMIRLRLPPEGALVSINERLIPDAEIKAGVQVPAYLANEVKVSKAGKREERFTATLAPGQELERFIELKDERGKLSIRSQPTGADVLINGRLFGKTPLSIIDLDPHAKLTVTVKKRGAGNVSRTIDFTAASDLQFDVMLEDSNPRFILHGAEEGQYGYLIANTHPWAKVFIDGWDTGMSTPIGPRDRIPLKPGKHDVSFVTSDKRLTVETLIRAGEEAKIVRDLNDSLDIKEPTSNRAQKLATGTDKEKVANGLLDEARLLAKTDPARARNLCRKVMELFANSPKVPKVQEAYRLLGDIKGGKDKDDDF